MRRRASGQRQRGDGQTAPSTASAKHGDRDAQPRSGTAARSRAGGRSAAGGRYLGVAHAEVAEETSPRRRAPGMRPLPGPRPPGYLRAGLRTRVLAGGVHLRGGGGGREGGGRSASAARRLLPFLEGRGPRRGGRCPARPPLPAPPAVPVPAAPRLRQAGGLARACHFLPRREGGGGLGRGAAGRRGGGCGEVLPGQPTPPPGPPPPRARPRAGPSLPAGARCHGDAAPGPPRSRPEWFGFFFFPSPWLWFSFSSFLPPLLSLRIPLAV